MIDVISTIRTDASRHPPNVTAKQPRVQRRGGEKGHKVFIGPCAFTWRRENSEWKKEQNIF